MAHVGIFPGSPLEISPQEPRPQRERREIAHKVGSIPGHYLRQAFKVPEEGPQMNLPWEEKTNVKDSWNEV